jgi:hypothetical protein
MEFLFIIASNDFKAAARRAAEMDLHITEWEWCPIRTVQNAVVVFLRTDDDKL